MQPMHHGAGSQWPTRRTKWAKLVATTYIRVEKQGFLLALIPSVLAEGLLNVFTGANPSILAVIRIISGTLLGCSLLLLAIAWRGT